MSENDHLPFERELGDELEEFWSLYLRILEVSTDIEVSGSGFDSLVHFLSHLAGVMDRILTFTPLTERAMSRFTHAANSLTYFSRVVEEIDEVQGVPEEITSPFLRMFRRFVYAELLPIYIGLISILISPERRIESSVYDHNGILYEPFRMSDEVRVEHSNLVNRVEIVMMTLMENIEEITTDDNTDGASAEDIEKYTSRYKYTKIERTNDENSVDTCTVCQYNMEENQDARRLPCLHVFHLACADEWLKEKKNCPTCRQMIDEPQDGVEAMSGA